MITIEIHKGVKPNKKNHQPFKLVSKVEIDIEENKTNDFINDLTLNINLLKWENLSVIFFMIFIDPNYYPIFSNKSLDEIKTIIEAVATTYV